MRNKAYSFISKNKNENDEKKYISEFLSNNQIDHSFVSTSKNIDKDILEELIFYQDEPISAMSFLNQYILRKKIHQDGFKVLLVGEGGDEIMGGYNRMFLPYLYSVYLKNKKEIPDQVKKNISINMGNNFKSIIKSVMTFSKRLNKISDIEDKNPFKYLNIKETNLPRNLKFYNNTSVTKQNSFKSFLLNHIFKRDLPHILRQEDRISMSQSIENRTPFVDHKLLEYVFSIDEKYFMYDGKSKYMLRSIMENKLPNSFFKKKKIGRPGDPSSLIFNTYYELFLDLLNSKKTINNHFDNKKIVQSVISDKKNKNHLSSNFYFRVLNYLIWKKNFNI